MRIVARYKKFLELVLVLIIMPGLLNSCTPPYVKEAKKYFKMGNFNRAVGYYRESLYKYSNDCEILYGFLYSYLKTTKIKVDNLEKEINFLSNLEPDKAIKKLKSILKEEREIENSFKVHISIKDLNKDKERFCKLNWDKILNRYCKRDICSVSYIIEKLYNLEQQKKCSFDKFRKKYPNIIGESKFDYKKLWKEINIKFDKLQQEILRLKGNIFFNYFNYQIKKVEEYKNNFQFLQGYELLLKTLANFKSYKNEKYTQKTKNEINNYIKFLRNYLKSQLKLTKKNSVYFKSLLLYYNLFPAFNNEETLYSNFLRNVYKNSCISFKIYTTDYDIKKTLLNYFSQSSEISNFCKNRGAIHINAKFTYDKNIISKKDYTYYSWLDWREYEHLLALKEFYEELQRFIRKDNYNYKEDPCGLLSAEIQRLYDNYRYYSKGCENRIKISYDKFIPPWPNFEICNKYKKLEDRIKCRNSIIEKLKRTCRERINYIFNIVERKYYQYGPISNVLRKLEYLEKTYVWTFAYYGNNKINYKIRLNDGVKKFVYSKDIRVTKTYKDTSIIILKGNPDKACIYAKHFNKINDKETKCIKPKKIKLPNLQEYKSILARYYASKLYNYIQNNCLPSYSLFKIYNEIPDVNYAKKIDLALRIYALNKNVLIKNRKKFLLYIQKYWEFFKKIKNK